ncbi:MAG: PKD domain-containing protein, partial [Cyclobacteriaceae bacterium]
TYSSPGTFNIRLEATDENGISTSQTKQITVANSVAPDISISIDNNQCLANTNTFTAIDNGGIDTYSWDFNADGIEDANEQNPNFQFGEIGTQDVQLVVQASNGCFNNVSQEVVIYPEPPVPDFEITNTLICSNTELFFSNLSDESAHNDEVLSYTWDFGGEQTSAEKNTNYTFGTGGTKQVSLTMAIPGCESFISKNIEIASGPDVAFEFNDECEGAEVPFINQTTGEGITDYQWDFGDGFTSNSVNPSHAYDAAGNYDITLTSSNDMGCKNSITQTITAHSIPVVSFINEVGCQNIPLQFTDQSLADNANITAWSWDFGGLGTSGEQNPQFTFSEAGEYNISLSAETNFGCLETISQTVSIAASPLVDFDVTVGCLNETTSFTDLTPTQQNNPIASWFWEIDGQVFTTQNPEYAFESPGEYKISLTVTPENNCAIKLTKDILIESLPVVDFSVNRTCDNEFTIFSDLSIVDTTPIISRTWDLGGLATANGPSAAFNFPQAGTYDITLTILNEKGCTNQTTKTIEIFGSPKAALEADVNFGAPPLEVNFLNKSVGANFYSWDFDDPSNSVSTDKDPGFTFNEVNDYRVRLIAGNELGCSDTTYTTIVSSIPTLDLQLVKMEPSLNNGKINLTLTILNSGTIKIQGFDIVVGIENDFSISESFTGALNAAEQITYTLNFEIPATGSNINYLCIKLEDRLSSTTDNNPLNNEKCTNFGQLVIIENPFPNPATDEVGFKLILPSTSNVDLSMVNIHGKTVYRQSFSNLSSGLNNFSIDLQSFERGMYFLKINTHSKEEIKRIIKF